MASHQHPSRFSHGLSEIVLVVRNVEACARFYRDVLRLEPEGEPELDWAWFHCGRGDPPQRLAVTNRVLAFEEFSPEPPGKRFGRIHFALLIPRTHLAEAVAHVRSCGVNVHGPLRHEWMKAESYYLYDPAGNLVEFYSPDE